MMALLVTVGAVAWVFSSLNASMFRFPKSPLLVAAALVPLAYLVSAFATGASWDSFAGNGIAQDTVIGFVLLYLAFFLAAQILGGSRSIPALRLFLVSALAVIIIQL